MASEEKGRTLPKFGEWDVNDPASAEGFTVIFSRARDEKKGGAAAGGHGPSHANNDHKPDNSPDLTKRWFCCF